MEYARLTMNKNTLRLLYAAAAGLSLTACVDPYYAGGYPPGPSPVYAGPPPVVVTPRPVYVQPRPVYVTPRPVYVSPRPGYGVGYRPGYGYGGHGYHPRRW